MKTFIVTLFLIIASTPILAQNALEAEVKELSKEKWQWMADKNVEELTKLFHKDAQFVHMGGAWGTDRELAIIESGGIWYKKADIHEVTIDIIGEDTAIVLNRITLLADPFIKMGNSRM